MADTVLTDLIISFPKSASGIIVLIKTPPSKYIYNKKTKIKIKRSYKLLVAYRICTLFCNGSYTMIAKPKKILELYYPVIQTII